MAHSVGFAALSGASVRYRFYSRWGVTADQLSRIVFSYSVTFWVGLLALGGLSFVVSPLPAAVGCRATWSAEIGWLLALDRRGLIVATGVAADPVRCWRIAFPLPPTALALRQLALSIADWLLAGAVLYVLLPADRPPFLAFLGAFLVAILLGMVSHVPGGIGVFEGLMVLLLKPWLTAAICCRRSSSTERSTTCCRSSWRRRTRRRRSPPAARAGRARRRMARAASPSAGAAAAGGVHVSVGRRAAVLGRHAGRTGAARSARSRAAARRHRDVAFHGQHRRRRPAGAVAGSGPPAGRRLLPLVAADRRGHGGVAAEGLRRRGGRPAARGAAGAASARVPLSIGGRPSSRHASRPPGSRRSSAPLARRSGSGSSPSSTSTMPATSGGGSSCPVTRRASSGRRSAPRWWCCWSGLARLVGHPPHEVAAPTEGDLDDAARVDRGTDGDRGESGVPARQGRCSSATRATGSSCTACRGDVGRDGRSGRRRRAARRLDSPIPRARRRFRRRHRRSTRSAPTHLHRYADFGMTFVKLGEEARVDLPTFSLEGGHAARFRQAVRRLERDGGTFRSCRRPRIPRICRQLRRRVGRLAGAEGRG